MRMLRVATLGVVLVGAAVLPGRVAAQEPGAAKEAASPDTVTYTSTRGTVKFSHAAHAKTAECAACHHASRPAKALVAAHQKCGDCHTNPPTEPVATSLRVAFHDADTGVCKPCHTKEVAAGKKAPARCGDCHQRVD